MKKAEIVADQIEQTIVGQRWEPGDLFGSEVEDYGHNLTPLNMVHPEVPEIFIVANRPPVSRAVPRRPDPPFNPDGSLPVQFPHRRGWHTDQSYRRPPPDVSLFLAVQPVPRGQGQTLFADGTAAYAALPPALKARRYPIATIEFQTIVRSRSRERPRFSTTRSPAIHRAISFLTRRVSAPMCRQTT